MRRDESSVGERGDVIECLHGHHATVPHRRPITAGLFHFVHFDRFASAVIYDEKLPHAAALRKRRAVRRERIANGAGTRRITPILAWLRGNGHLAVFLLREVEQRQPSAIPPHKLADDEVLS